MGGRGPVRATPGAGRRGCRVVEGIRIIFEQCASWPPVPEAPSGVHQVAA